MTREIILDIRNLTAGYAGKPVLRELNLTIDRGEAVGISGANGAGKTTLFKVILGLVPYWQGRVTILGRALDSARNRSWVRRQIGYVPQQTLSGKLPVSVHDGVLMGRWGLGFAYHRRVTPEERRLVAEILRRVGLARLEWQDCRRLSGGQQQKMAIARALIREAPLVLLDEPTTYLDRSSQGEIMALLQELRREQRLTLVMISHDRPQLQRLSDHLYDLDETGLRRANCGVD